MYRIYTLFLVGMLCLAACNKGVERTARDPIESLQDRYTSLGQAFRTLPGVQVDGTSAYYRGGTTITGENELLVAAEGRLLGFLAEAERTYPLNEIQRLRLLKPSDAQQRYGMQASAGVVELILRKK